MEPGRTVNGARDPIHPHRPRPLRLRLSTLALIVASSIVLVGLVLAIDTISDLDRTERGSDVRQAAALLESEVRARMEGLALL